MKVVVQQDGHALEMQVTSVEWSNTTYEFTFYVGEKVQGVIDVDHDPVQSILIEEDDHAPEE